MIVTVDTNVIYSALYSNSGASHQILKLILDEKLDLALSPPVFLEYYDVLSRDETLSRLSLSKSEIEDVLDLLVLLAKRQDIYYLLRPNLFDEKDNIFYECAFASNSQFLITSNIRHLKSSELRGFKFQIITPKEFYGLMEYET